jgi:hypothetical protein
MALKKRGEYYYGDSQADIRDEILRYSKKNGYPAQYFADAVCKCKENVFHLLLDDDEGAAVRICSSCKRKHPIGDSGDFLEDAELQECACPCGNEEYEISVGVSLYDDTEDVKWIYIGCHCTNCGLTAVYGDWKNEFQGYKKLLKMV